MKHLSDISRLINFAPLRSYSDPIIEYAEDIKEFGTEIKVVGMGKDAYEEILEDYDSRTKEGLLQLIDEGDWMLEIEIQQQMFFIDVLAAEQGYGQFFEVDYHPEYHGVYSDDIHEILEALAGAGKVEVDVGKYDGKIIGEYNHEGLDDQEKDEDIQNIVGKVNDRFGGLTVDELVEESRDHWIRQNTSLSKDVDFNKYQHKVHNGDVQNTFDIDKPINLNSDNLFG